MTTKTKSKVGNLAFTVGKVEKYYQSGKLQQARTQSKKLLNNQPVSVEALNQIGVVAAQHNDLKTAQMLLNKAIEIRPDHAMAYFNLGLVLRNAEQHKQAQSLYLKAIEIKPSFAEAHYNLANLLLEQGSEEDGIKHLYQAVESRTGYSPALRNLCELLGSQNRLDEIQDVCSKALTKDTRFAEAYFYLGMAQQFKGDLEAAAVSYNSAISARPGEPNYRFKAGTNFQLMGNAKAALQCFQACLKIVPNYAPAYHNIGTLFQQQGQLAQACEYFEKALEHKNNDINTFNSLAALYEAQGQLGKAEHYANEALARDPRSAYASRVAASVLRKKGQLDAALTVLSDIDIPGSLSATIHCELGAIYDQLHDYSKAFEHFQQGQAIQGQQAQTSRDDKDAYLDQLKQIRQSLSPTAMTTWPQYQRDKISPAPIFLLGFPYSGEDKLTQALGLHPDLNVIVEHSLLMMTLASQEALLEDYPTNLAQLSDDDIQELRQRYLALAAQFNKSGRIVDALPLNIIHIGLIHRMFPEAKIILALRHPADACLATLMHPFAHTPATASFYSLGDSVVLYNEVMGLWQQCAGQLSLNLRKVKYESLLDNYRAEIGGILGFLDLDWNDALLKASPQYPMEDQSEQRLRHHYKDAISPYMDTLEPLASYFGY